MKQCILIVGLPRTGTSAVAGILNRFGVDMGENFIDDEAWHPTGSFVDGGLHSLLLQHRHNDNLKEIKTHLNGRKEVFGIKDHALFSVFDSVLPLLENVKVIETVRPFEEAHASLMNLRGDTERELIETEWQQPIESIRGKYPWLTINFSELADGKAVGQRIAEFVGVPFNEKAVEHIDLRHSVFSIPRDIAYCLTPQSDLDILEQVLAQKAKSSGKMRILEIGTYLGATAKLLAKYASIVVTVDDYSGRHSYQPLQNYKEMAIANLAGNANVKVLDFDTTNPKLKGMLGHWQFDFCFIDGNHDYEYVKNDIDLCRQFLAPGGILCGHDWLFDSVRRAVVECDLPNLMHDGSVWWFSSQRQPSAREQEILKGVNSTPELTAMVQRRFPKAKVRKPVLLHSHQMPGDSVIGSIVVESLARQYPGQFDVDVMGIYTDEVFANCPHARRLDRSIFAKHNGKTNKHEDKFLTPCPSCKAKREVIGQPKQVQCQCGTTYEPNYPIKIEQPLIHQSHTGVSFGQAACDYVGKQLGIELRPQVIAPKLYFSAEEKRQKPLVSNYCLINAGWKDDCEVKYYDRWQEVVNLIHERYPKLKIVQIGEDIPGHNHPALEGRNIVNMVGKWNNKGRIPMVWAYHSAFGLGPISFLMHIYAGVEKPYICAATSREHPRWACNYPKQTYISRFGTLPCCALNGCWRNSWQPGGKKSHCTNMIGDKRPACMNHDPMEFIRAIEKYVEGGMTL